MNNKLTADKVHDIADKAVRIADDEAYPFGHFDHRTAQKVAHLTADLIRFALLGEETDGDRAND